MCTHLLFSCYVACNINVSAICEIKLTYLLTLSQISSSSANIVQGPTTTRTNTNATKTITIFALPEQHTGNREISSRMAARAHNLHDVKLQTLTAPYAGHWSTKSKKPWELLKEMYQQIHSLYSAQLPNIYPTRKYILKRADFARLTRNTTWPGSQIRLKFS